ncbi:MAG: DinB family protein [bacterium]
MSKENITITSDIYTRCSQTLLAAIEATPVTQMTWKPSPESRSIAEICRHIIRVDGWFLQQIGFDAKAGDPGANDLSKIEAALCSLRDQINELLGSLKSDAELRLDRKGKDAQRAYSLNYVVKHISQHYLYHTSQIIYLRRSQDRSWESPLKLWEKTVDSISEHIWKGQSA